MYHNPLFAIDFYKDPVTANGSKKSAKGLLMVNMDCEINKLVLHDDVNEDGEECGFLEIVFENGYLIRNIGLGDIRYNLNNELEMLS